MKLRGTIFIVGRVGPFPVADERLLDAALERLTADPAAKVGFMVGNDVIVGRVTHAEATGAIGQRGISVDVEVDESLLEPGPLAALQGAAENLGEAVE